jgi:hypothetical protein
MTPKQEGPPPLEIIAYTVAALGAIAGLVFLIPKLIVAVGEAVGLAFGGAAAAGTVAWAAPVASAGLGLTGGVLVLNLLITATKEAKKEPYEWGVPLLGIVSSIVLDITKEFALDNTVLKVFVSALIAFLVVIAGAYYKRGGLQWRIVAVLLILAPPIAVLVQNLDMKGRASIGEALRSIPTPVWFRLCGFLLIGGAMLGLHYLTTRKGSYASG